MLYREVKAGNIDKIFVGIILNSLETLASIVRIKYQGKKPEFMK